MVEIELWEAGAGSRGGHQPFDLTIFYSDLLHAMVDRLGSSRRHGRLKVLERRGGCVICADVRGGTPPGTLVTHAGMDLQRWSAEANQMRFTEGWLAETRPRSWADLWPDCAATASVSAAAGTLPCRVHLLNSDSFSDASLELTCFKGDSHAVMRWMPPTEGFPVSLRFEGSAQKHIPSPDQPSVPELEIDQNIAPRPEEEIADVLRAEPDVEDHSQHHE